MNEWTDEWTDEWTNEWMNEWINEWINEWYTYIFIQTEFGFLSVFVGVLKISFVSISLENLLVNFFFRGSGIPYNFVSHVFWIFVIRIKRTFESHTFVGNINCNLWISLQCRELSFILFWREDKECWYILRIKICMV